MKTINASNIKARAKKLGLVVTKAWPSGQGMESAYVLHRQGDDLENMEVLSLYGVQHQLMELEFEAMEAAE